MKNKILFLLACCFFVACSDKEEPLTPPAEAADITIFAYLVANNNLNGYIYSNIGAMYEGLSDLQESADLLIYWDGKTSVGNQSTHAILRFRTDGKGSINGVPALDVKLYDTDFDGTLDDHEYDAFLDDVLPLAEVVKEYSSQLSTDKATMARVLTDMSAFVTTDKVGLIAGSHGSAWTNSIYLTSRSFGQDGSGTDNTILVSDMAEAMKATGQTFDFLLFDACYMGTIEVCDAFKDVTRYQIVSPLEVPAYGFPYGSMMKDLYKASVEGYTRACETYIAYYQGLYQDYINGISYNSTWGTVALVDSQEIPSLSQLVKEQVTGHAEELADYYVGHLQEYGKRNGKYISFDLMHFVKDLNGEVLPESFQRQLDKTVLYKGCLEKAYPTYFNVNKDNYCGLGLFIPNSSTPNWNAYFETTPWYSLLGWNQVSFVW